MDEKIKKRKESSRNPGLMKGVFKQVRDFFASPRVTVPLLILLAVTSIIGTLIEQNLSEEKYLRHFGISVYHIFRVLGFFDVYHSVWYICLFLLLTINLLTCSFKRFPGTWKTFFHTSRELDEVLIRALPYKKSVTKRGLPEAFSEDCKGILARYFAKPVETHQVDGGLHLYSERGRFSRLGVYFAHLGIIVIFIGALIGSIFGFKGYVNIVEGESVGSISLRGDSSPFELGFQVRCDDFSVSYYPGKNSVKGIPKEYKSVLTVIEGGRNILQKDVRVNHPLRYRGFSFYQSDYGTATWGKGSLLLQVTPRGNEEEKRDYSVELGGDFRIEGTPYTVRFTRLVPDFLMDANGRVTSRSLKMNNPAALLTLLRKETPLYSTWVFRNFSDFHGKGDGDYQFTFVDFKSKEYTFLQVTKDPGVWVVWSGCAFLICGVLSVFFFSHRRVWVRIIGKEEKTHITLAGTTSKNRGSFEHKFEELKEAIETLCQNVVHNKQTK